MKSLSGKGEIAKKLAICCTVYHIPIDRFRGIGQSIWGNESWLEFIPVVALDASFGSVSAKPEL
jgi:hypothetical protein